MKCEICHTNTATVHVKHVRDGNVEEIFVCAGCAKKKGWDVEEPLSLMDFLVGGDGGETSDVSSADRRCDSCGLKRGEFKKNSRLGCPDCYTAFENDLLPLIQALHKHQQHTGKTPARHARAARIVSLRGALKEAVKTQNFEEAATLRDRIRALEEEYSAHSEADNGGPAVSGG